MMPVLVMNGVKTGHYIMWHHVLQSPVHVSAELQKGLVLPWQCSQPRFVSTFMLPQKAPGNVVITTVGIRPIEHEGIDAHTKFIAYLDGVLEPFHQRLH
jgi:hypothetical protein